MSGKTSLWVASSLGPHMVLPRYLHRERELPSSFYKATNPRGLGATLMISFSLKYLIKALSPNSVTWQLTTSTCEFRGNSVHRISPQNLLQRKDRFHQYLDYFKFLSHTPKMRATPLQKQVRISDPA